MLATSDATAVRPANVRSRTTNRPRKMALDGRTALGRRVADLAESYAAALGGWPALTDMQAANVRRAAELAALAEQARADALRTGNSDPTALVKLDGAASRAVRALGLDRQRKHDGREALAAYLATKHPPEVTPK
jgi:hypothetical protein